MAVPAVRAHPGVVNNLRRDPGSRLSLIHRLAAVVFGLGLWVFGGLGVANQLEPFSTSGTPVLGLSSNGLLSGVSLLVGAVLIAAGIRGGRLASTVLTVVGAAFMLSGVANVLVLETPYNVMAFRMSNVIFSLLAGGLLLILGTYGRFTGRLPDDNPYAAERATTDGGHHPEPTHMDTPADALAATELAAAERADAQHAASPVQAARLRSLSTVRRTEDRIAAWRASGASG